MTNVLIVLTLPEAIRNRYRDRIAAISPALRVDVVDHHTRVDPFMRDAEILVTFGPMMSSSVFKQADNLKWVQALGSGVDGIVDQPAPPSRRQAGADLWRRHSGFQGHRPRLCLGMERYSHSGDGCLPFA